MDTGNFMACCSVTQSQEVGQSAAVWRKIIMRSDLGVSVFNMCSDEATCLPDSMAHLFRVVDSEIWSSVAYNYKIVCTMLEQLFFYLLFLSDESTQEIRMWGCCVVNFSLIFFSFVSLLNPCSVLSITIYCASTSSPQAQKQKLLPERLPTQMAGDNACEHRLWPSALRADGNVTLTQCCCLFDLRSSP